MDGSKEQLREARSVPRSPRRRNRWHA